MPDTAHVPARVGGVDLSFSERLISFGASVPARVGGVDLSEIGCEWGAKTVGPRPCGRGGFKLESRAQIEGIVLVPARVGGVDLSFQGTNEVAYFSVPARVGGVDLSTISPDLLSIFPKVPARVGGVDLSNEDTDEFDSDLSLRPCGRGGFKPYSAGAMTYNNSPRPCGRGGFKLMIYAYCRIC